ncbi:MAG: hypothetical protein LM570_04185 [Thermocrinis sp.]|nr:hypothetical protein [Thermocrinis sp.]
MPKVDNDAVVQYLNYLYERSLALSDSLEILERMWEMSKNVDYVQLEDFRMKKQAYQSALSEFASAKDVYTDFIQNPRSYSTLQPATDLQTKLRNLVLRQVELKQSIEVIAPALRALYPDLFYLKNSVNNTRLFNRLLSGFLSSVSQIVKLGFNVLFNPLLEFGYVNLVEEQTLLIRRLLYLQWKSVNHSGLGFGIIVPNGFNPSLLPDLSNLPEIGQPCPPVPRLVSSTCYDIYAVCERGLLVGYKTVPNSDWSPYHWYPDYFDPHHFGNLLTVPHGLSGDDPRSPKFLYVSSLAGVLVSYQFHYANAAFPLPFQSDAPVYIAGNGNAPWGPNDTNAWWCDSSLYSYYSKCFGQDGNPYLVCEYIPPFDCGQWHFSYDPCYVCNCSSVVSFVVDNCFHTHFGPVLSGQCSCRKVCEFDWDNPATYPKEIILPWPNIPRARPPDSPSLSVPEYNPLPPNFDDLTDDEKGEICRTVSQTLPLRDLSPYLNPFPLPLGDVPYIEVSPDLLPQLDPDTLIQPLPIPSPQRFIVRPSTPFPSRCSPYVSPDTISIPAVEVVVEIFPEEELIPAINWLITQEVVSVVSLTNTLQDALPNSDKCREQEQMLYANFDELRNLIFYSFVGLASIFGFISALLVSMSIFELWKNIPIRRV